MKFESELIDPKPEKVRRVVIELPESRAKALAYAIDRGIKWHETEVGDELEGLYDALNPLT